MIFIDNRVGSCELARMPPLDKVSELVSLDECGLAGDVTFNINGPNESLSVGIEVKTVSDLVSSTNSGRLQGQGDGTESSRGQFIRMLDTYDVVWLVYYGNYWASEDDKPVIKYINGSIVDSIGRVVYHYMTKLKTRYNLKSTFMRTVLKTLEFGKRTQYWASLQAALIEFQFIGIKVTHVSSINEVAIFIHTLHKWGNKPWDGHRLFSTFNMANTVTGKTLLPTIPKNVLVRARLISGITNIGFKRAVDIAERYDSIQEMISKIAGNPLELKSIRGIGEVLSRDVYNRLRQGKVQSVRQTRSVAEQQVHDLIKDL